MNAALESILLDELKLPTDALRPDAALDDAGFDSLAFVELSVLLKERLGVELADTDLKNAGTLGGLDLLVDQQASGR